MNITIDLLKKVYAVKKYNWEPNLNIIGIRTTLQVADVFNDLLVVVWTQQSMPNGLSDSQKQEWLNANLFLGKDGKPLLIDGDFGDNSKHALSQYQAVVGKERMKMYTITTDPGTYWLENPMNSLGTAVLKPGQWVNCWALGYHQNKPDHEALVQVGKITVYRDGDKDKIAESGPTIDNGLFGVNIHGSNKNGITQSIGKWSAGCMVFNEWVKKEEFISICKQFKESRHNKFSYCLIEEKDLSI